jgi:DNA-binding NarL/FixJ family response regulator
MLPPRVQATAWADGVAMSFDETGTYALTADDALLVPSPTTAALASPLTPCVYEVAVLIGRGLTNRQIGEMLVITEGTARIHVAHVLA